MANEINKSDDGALFCAKQTNRSAERAYWWMKGINKNTAERLGVADMVSNVLSLLQKVDDVTMDIQITIKNKVKK